MKENLPMATSSRSASRGQSASAPPPTASSPEPPAPPEAQPERHQPVFTWAHPTSSGRIEIAVWEKVVSGDNGDRSVYSVTCQRSYRKQEGGYENTGTFWHTDLLVLAHGLQVVFDRIKQLHDGSPF
jgi:hypothetical protein